MQITFPEITGNDIVYMDCLNALVGDKRESFLDIGCNRAPFTPRLGFEDRNYIDALPRVLDFPDEQKNFRQMDVLATMKHIPKQVNFALDVIEHLTKEDGKDMLDIMKWQSSRQIIFTPLNEWMMTDEADKNPESHRSLWTPADLDEEWITIVFPNYHPTLGIGAWFGMRCDNLDMEFMRIIQELSQKEWYQNAQKQIKGNGKLAGVTFIRNAVSLDYCIEACVKSLQAICDAVFIVYAESTDGTLELLESILDDKTKILTCTEEQWQSQQGRTKLSSFQNAGIDYAQIGGYEYVLLVQADEALDLDSIPYIKRAIELGEEGYYCTRHNLWGSEDTMLNVSQSRKPCSTTVNRLTKSFYRSVDDGESIATPTASLDFINQIVIWHAGFIRCPKRHIAKIKEIQGNIFLMDVDSRVKEAEEFDPWGMGFTKEDVIPIPRRLPRSLLDWKDKSGNQ